MKTLARSGPANLDAFARVIQINLIGTFNCIRLAIRLDGAIRMAPR